MSCADARIINYLAVTDMWQNGAVAMDLKSRSSSLGAGSLMEINAASALFFKTLCLVMVPANPALTTCHAIERRLLNIMYALIFYDFQVK